MRVLYKVMKFALVVYTCALVDVHVGEAQGIGGLGIIGRIEINRVSSEENLPAKMSDVFRCFWKNIEISHPSPQIDKNPSIHRFQDLLGRDASNVCKRRPSASKPSMWPRSSIVVVPSRPPMRVHLRRQYT